MQGLMSCEAGHVWPWPLCWPCTANEMVKISVRIKKAEFPCTTAATKSLAGDFLVRVADNAVIIVRPRAPVHVIHFDLAVTFDKENICCANVNVWKRYGKKFSWKLILCNYFHFWVKVSLTVCFSFCMQSRPVASKNRSFIKEVIHVAYFALYAKIYRLLIMTSVTSNRFTINSHLLVTKIYKSFFSFLFLKPKFNCLWRCNILEHHKFPIL